MSITSEYGLYLYTGKVDMRKGIDGLCGIISEELGHNPRKHKNWATACSLMQVAD